MIDAGGGKHQSHSKVLFGQGRELGAWLNLLQENEESLNCILRVNYFVSAESKEVPTVPP